MEERKWEILSSEYIARRPWLTARKDCVRLPDGRINPEYWVLEFPDWVNVIALTKDGLMVMERQYRHAALCTCYELPCGVIEAGESPLEAAKRELLEETGYGNGTWVPLMSISANPSNHTNRAHTFIARDVEKIGSQHLDSTEDLTVHLLTQERVKELLDGKEMIQALMIAPLYRFFVGELSNNQYFTIRKTNPGEQGTVLSILSSGRKMMHASGNTAQWPEGTPSPEKVLNDICSGCSYLVMEGENPVATFAFIPGPDPTYSRIDGGSWLNDDPYYVIHRIAKQPWVHGIFRFVLDWCFIQTDNIRIDTHKDNSIMQHCIGAYGFKYCGIIYLENGEERLAFQKLR